MPLTTGLEATLSQEPTLLHSTRFRRCRVTITGIAGEFTEIVFKVGTRPGVAEEVRGLEVKVPFRLTSPFTRIWAVAPEGVGALDIVYEVGTGPDA